MRRRSVLRATALGAGRLGAGAFGSGAFGADDNLVGGSEATSDESPATAAYEPLGHLDHDAAYETVTDGETAFVATGDGFATVDVTNPAEPTLLTHETDLLADHERGPMTKIYDVVLDGDELLVLGPAHPANVVNAGVRFDVAEPAQPERLSVVETPFPIHNADFADGVAYLTGNDHDRNALVMVDFGVGEVVGRWSVIDHDETWSEVHSALRVIHDVTVVDGVAYLACWDAGTHMVDVSDPAAPEHLGSVAPHDPADLAALSGDDIGREQTALPGNHHFAAPNPDGTLLALNKEAWAVVEETGELRGGPGGIEIYDVADPAVPTLLATIEPTRSPDATRSGVWTTAHNFQFRDDRLYTSWYEAGVKLYDVSDPAAPEELAAWRDPDNRSFWTAQVAVPGEFFVASSTNARAEPGLFTFPDRAGEQPDKPPMETALAGTDTATTTDTATATDTATTATPTPSPTAATETEGSGTSVPDAGPIEGAAPGFGVGAGALGVGAGAVGAGAWVRRRAALGGDDSPGAEADGSTDEHDDT